MGILSTILIGAVAELIGGIATHYITSFIDSRMGK